MSTGLHHFKSQYVYRALRPNEDPNDDIKCSNKHSSFDIESHVDSGLHDRTRFISTTTTLENAHRWMRKADEKTSWKYHNQRSVIVQIDVELLKLKYPRVTNAAYDLTDPINRNYFLKTNKTRAFCGSYPEIAFMDCIPSEAVTIVYTTQKGYINNAPKSNSAASIQSKSFAYIQSNSAAPIQSNSAAPIQSNAASIQSNSAAYIQSKSFASIQSKSFASIQSKSFASIQSNSAAPIQSNAASIQSNSAAYIQSKSFASIQSKSFASIQSKSFASIQSNSAAPIQSKSAAPIQSKSAASIQSKSAASIQSKSAASIQSKSAVSTHPQYTAIPIDLTHLQEHTNATSQEDNVDFSLFGACPCLQLLFRCVINLFN